MSPSDISNYAQRISQPIAMFHLLLWCFAFIFISSTSTSSSLASAEVIYTAFQCNFTAFPKTGCEDEIGAECIDNRCKCKPDHSILYDGRFCFLKSCPAGQYFDEYQNVCVAQRRASPSVADSHCRYDYHCFGSHVRCKLHGWNRNCVCETGFVFGFNGTCIPMFGIGGHCSRDFDCDNTGHRKMLCEVKPDDTKGTGTCQCMADHTYNYQVDGCESNERIRERKANMRTLIILFIIAGCVLGFACTFNFGFLNGSPRQQQAILLKRIEEEKQRYEKRIAQQLKAAEEGNTSGATGQAAPSAPLAVKDTTEGEEVNTQPDSSPEHSSATDTVSSIDKKRLIAL